MDIEAPASAPGTWRIPVSWCRRVRHLVGGFYLVTAGVNAGLVVADAEAYRHFADGTYLDVVTRQWNDVVMANPVVWVLLLAGGELVLGILLLRGGTSARLGWVGVIAFHVLLMLFGPGTWLWCIPALALLVPAARADWPQLGTASTSRAVPGTDGFGRPGR